MKKTDREIPDRVVAHWDDVGDKLRTPVLRRELLPDERHLLEARVAELRAAVAPYPPNVGVAEREGAVAAMLGAFPAMQRHSDVSADEMVADYLWVCRNEPHWAIIEACEAVRSKTAGINPAFCPSQPEFRDVVLARVEYYRQRLAKLEPLLTARVLPPPDPKPSRAEIEARLGRPLPDSRPRWDPGARQRVEADLARRRREREATAVEIEIEPPPPPEAA